MTRGSMGEGSNGGCAEFEDHLPLIDDVVDSVCRRRRVYDQDAEDLASQIKLRLWEDDCEALNGARGQATLKAYLTAVTVNLARDEMTRLLGRWRPSVAAQRLGLVAMRLERLLQCDGRPLGEALEILRLHHRVNLSRAELEDIAAQLPSRARRRFLSLDAAPLHVDQSRPEDRLVAQESEKTRKRVELAVKEAFAMLATEDRLILRMRFQSDLQISAIARALGRPQKPFYRHLERLTRELRRSLRDRGLEADEVLDSLAEGDAEWSFDFDLAPKVDPWDGPSHRAEEE